jgi:hypothetical protein
MVIEEKLESDKLVKKVFGKVIEKPILLMGNGPSVTKHKWGERIDAYFDTIVRLNGVILPGKEAFAGSRADLWFHNFQIKASMNAIHELRDNGDRGMKMFVVYQMEKHQDHGKFEHFFGAYLSHIPWCYTDIKVHNEAMRYTARRPTMGLLSLTWLLKHGFNNIYLHGFDMLDILDGKKFDGRHYDGRPGGFGPHVGHRPNLDVKAFKRAMDYGLAKVWDGSKPK